MLEHEEREHEKGSRERMEKIMDESLKCALTMKARLKARGLRKGHMACPRTGCAGRVRAFLSGPRDHIHMRCDNPDCYINLME